MRLAPAQKLIDRAAIGFAGVTVADVEGKEIDETLGRLCAARGDQRGQALTDDFRLRSDFQCHSDSLAARSASMQSLLQQSSLASPIELRTARAAGRGPQRS